MSDLFRQQESPNKIELDAPSPLTGHSFRWSVPGIQNSWVSFIPAKYKNCVSAEVPIKLQTDVNEFY